ncbi:class I SAM-dependent methyltransferase [Candidatus Pelagibacter sp.]|nr:class I SAM-dependent methyltransferase [Candidatus Pelagibacter sp.]
MDKKTNIIFLSDVNHVSKVVKKNIDQFASKNFKDFVNIEKYKNKKLSLRPPDDDLRRFQYMKKFLKNKSVLDFGCGIGTFIKLAKNITKKCHGFEINKKLIFKLKKEIKIFSKMNQINEKYDFITMFHVLEHIPNSIEILKNLKKLLKSNGKLIIEIPHAKDILFNVDEFKNFSLWSEHLVLHTEKSIIKILKHCGFKIANINYIQRYSLTNHIGWFVERKPEGHVFLKNLYDKKIDKKYIDYLIKNKITDTLLIEAKI